LGSLPRRELEILELLVDEGRRVQSVGAKVVATAKVLIERKTLADQTPLWSGEDASGSAGAEAESLGPN